MTDQNNTLNGIKEIEDSIHSFKSIENMELSTRSIDLIPSLFQNEDKGISSKKSLVLAFIILCCSVKKYSFMKYSDASNAPVAQIPR